MAERTLIIIKPDGLGRHLAGEIISRFEKKGFKLVAARFLQISEELGGRLYAAHKKKHFFERAVKYICSGPCLVMVWQGQRVIETSRKMIGATFGYEAEAGTIRGDFNCSGRYNLVHGADSAESAREEIELFFQPEEILEYDIDEAKWLSNDSE